MSIKTIIAIHGQKGSGKSTLAKALEYPIVSFAGPIKAMINVLLMEAGFTAAQISYWIHDEKGKDEVIPPPINCTGRHLMQTLGTEWGRGMVNQAVWPNILLAKSSKMSQGVSAIANFLTVDDLRFPSEMEILNESPHHTLFVKVVRPDRVYADNHASEQGLPDEEFDLVIVNDFNSPQKYTYYATLAVMEMLRERGLTSSVQP